MSRFNLDSALNQKTNKEIQEFSTKNSLDLSHAIIQVLKSKLDPWEDHSEKEKPELIKLLLDSYKKMGFKHVERIEDYLQELCKDALLYSFSDPIALPWLFLQWNH